MEKERFKKTNFFKVATNGKTKFTVQNTYLELEGHSFQGKTTRHIPFSARKWAKLRLFLLDLNLLQHLIPVTPVDG